MVNSTQRFIPPLVANVTVNRAMLQCRIDARGGIFSKAVSFLCGLPSKMLNTVATARNLPCVRKPCHGGAGLAPGTVDMTICNRNPPYQFACQAKGMENFMMELVIASRTRLARLEAPF